MIKRPNKVRRVVLTVSGCQNSQVGISKMIRSKTAVVTTWVTMMRMNSIWSREPKPQQWPETLKSQNDETGMQGNQLQTPKVMPERTVTTSMALQNKRMRTPSVKTRRYWRSKAILMKVLDNG